MQKWTRAGLAAALVLVLVASILGYSVAGAKAAKPQDQVKNFMSAAAGLKASKAAGYWVTDASSNVTSQLANIPSGTKISISKLKLAVSDQNADTAKVTATYTIKVQLKDQKKAQQTNLSDTFNLKLVNSTWLISASTIWDHLAGLVTASTPTPTGTTTATTTATPTPSATTSGNPIKIGVIYPRSGPFAVCATIYDPIVNLVEEQIRNQGGILGGREIKLVQGDDRGVVAEAAAQAKKLITDNKVSMLTFGGVSAASFDAVSAVAEEYHIPYVALAALNDLANKKYSADIVGWPQDLVEHKPHIEYLKPKSIAFLGYDISDIHYMMDGIEGITGMREWVKAMGIDIVYEQFYPVSTVDFSPYITKIKYLKPDLLFFWANDVGQELSIRKQIMELGGYGNMKFFSACMSGSSPKVTKNSASWGTYTNVQWTAGSSDPGMKAFEDTYVKKYGKEPDDQVPIGYTCIWTAIKAIELANSDNPEKVAQALRSGNLQWDSAMGPVRIDSTGHGWVQYGMGQIQDGGKIVQVYP